MLFILRAQSSVKDGEVNQIESKDELEVSVEKKDPVPSSTLVFASTIAAS